MQAIDHTVKTQVPGKIKAMASAYTLMGVFEKLRMARIGGPFGLLKTNAVYGLKSR